MASRNLIKQFELDIAIRRGETQLWQRGVRIVAPNKDAADYHAAREFDPDFSLLCADLNQLAARYKKKYGVEVELSQLYGKAVTMAYKIRRV